MTVRIVFLREGSSDDGLVPHIEGLAADRDIEVSVTAPDFDRLPRPPGSSVKKKLYAIQELGGVYDMIIVHRDADNQGVDARVAEIRQAVASMSEPAACVPVVPVRMTEAWLLTSESEIRQVAGDPNGRVSLQLPKIRSLEDIADPKAMLAETLARASGLSGRRLDRFKKRFPQQRRQLLDRLDREGPITSLPSWQHFLAGFEAALQDTHPRH